MIAADLSPKDREAVQQVSTKLGAVFVTAGHPVLMEYADDPAVSPLALPLGIIGAHVMGLASALSTLDEGPRAEIIRRLPSAVTATIQAGEIG